jgi:formylmethanofuran dehydrogenase subunit C
MRQFFSKFAMGSGSVTINGQTFQGKTVEVRNGQVWVDGQLQPEGKLAGQPVLNVVVTGDVAELETASGDVSVAGSVGAVTTTAGDVTCGDVRGNLETVSGDIRCGRVSGDVETLSGDIYRT